MDTTKTILVSLVIVLSIALIVIGIAGGFIILNYNITPKVGNEDINSFDDCVAAGYPVAESYPEQCFTDDGKSFTNPNQSIPPETGGDQDGSEDPDIAPAEPSLDLPIYEGDGDVSCTDNCGDGECAEVVCLGTGCACAETPKSCPQDCK